MRKTKTKTKTAKPRSARRAKTSGSKMNASRRKAVNRRKIAPKSAAHATVEQYIAAAPTEARAALKQIRAAILSVVPAEATEIISYKIPAFKHKKVLVWYGVFSEHCSLFPTAAVVGQFKEDLQGYSTAKGTVHFPLSRPMPLTLIKKMVQARLARTA